MDHQHPHSFLRQPPPPPPHAPPTAADPYQRPPPLPPPPPGQSWPYSNQFQYQTQHSPSPPPPQWVPQQPHSSDHAQYPHPPPPPPYPAHQPPLYPVHPHYPPPQPLPPRPPHVPQSYSQDWGNGSWSHHQSWDYPTNNNKEDWGEKARAWAAAKAATDNHYPLPAGRSEEQNHFHEQYSQSINPQSHSVHVSLDQSSSYQQYTVGIRPPNRTGLGGQLQESQYVSPGQSSFASDMHAPYAVRDGSLIGDSYEQFPQQEQSSISPLVHQQEVPSSYSSVSGNEDAGDRYGKFNSSSSLSVPSMPHHHVQPLPPAVGRSGWTEEPHHLLSSQPAESVTDLSDQPLNFAPHFNRNLDQHMQPNFTHPSGGPVRGLDPTVAISSNYAWTPSSAPGAVYPPVPSTLPSGPQVDHPIAVPSPASGHSAPIFPTGPGFQSTVPLIGAAFGVGSGVVSHSTASFSGDAYGVSGVERPKKASVPNWLREEIIKNKSVITTSVPKLSQEDSQSIEEDSNDKPSRKGDQADSKSIDSSRSTEDDDDGDEDEVEAARTAAINQEIKRVLTEVLLKVTDELFDEIATKVLNEDDLSVEVGHNVDLSNQRVLSSTPAISTPLASAKVLIPIKAVKNDFEDGSEKSASGSAGDVLGLSSYASDEEDDEIQISGKLNSKESSTHHQSSLNKLLEGPPSVDNGGSREGTEEPGNILAKMENTGKKSPIITAVNRNAADTDLNYYRASETRRSSKKASRVAEDEMQHGSDISKLNKSVTETAVERNERPDGNLDVRKSSDDSRSRKSGNRSDKNDRRENRRTSDGKDHKESGSAKERVDKKGDEDHRRHEERHARTERMEYHDGSKDKGKEKSRTDEKVKDAESRKLTSPMDGKEGKSETRRDKRTNAKEDGDEKRQDKPRDVKKERSRYKNGSSSSRHKPHRSSSVGSRDGGTKDNSVVNHPNDSSDESSDDSRSRKSHHSKRHKSPSPTRSRKRQVSRSPHSKHSKRRHTPYSSLETTRGRRSPSRSRSRSPVTRRR